MVLPPTETLPRSDTIRESKGGRGGSKATWWGEAPLAVCRDADRHGEVAGMSTKRADSCLLPLWRSGV